MVRPLAILALALAFVALSFGIRARHLVRRGSIPTKYPFNVGLILPVGLIIGTMPVALGLHNNALLIIASVISFTLSAIALYLLRRSLRS